MRGSGLRDGARRVFAGVRCGGLTVSSSGSLKRPLRLLWRKPLELPVFDIRILASRAFCKRQQTMET